MAIQQPLTLTGLAGLVLTVGMSVDANVLIFERIREEIDRGSTLRMAIRNGFDKARTTIVDANVTTLITAIVLYTVGTEQVKGFAVTLILGILISMFTAIFCSRIIFDIAERKRWLTKLNMMRILDKKKFDFLGKISITGVMSALLIGLGIAGMVLLGSKILDHDLRGGSTIRIVFNEKQEINDIRKILDETDMEVNGEKIEFSVAGFGGAEQNADDKGKIFRIDSNLPAWEGGPGERWKQLDEVMAEKFPGKLRLHKVQVTGGAGAVGSWKTGTPQIQTVAWHSLPRVVSMISAPTMMLQESGSEPVTPVVGQETPVVPEVTPVVPEGTPVVSEGTPVIPQVTEPASGTKIVEPVVGTQEVEPASATKEMKPVTKELELGSVTKEAEPASATKQTEPASDTKVVEPDSADQESEPSIGGGGLVLPGGDLKVEEEPAVRQRSLSFTTESTVKIDPPILGKSLRAEIVESARRMEMELEEEQIVLFSDDILEDEGADGTVSENWTIKLNVTQEEDGAKIIDKWSEDLNAQPYFPTSSKVGSQIAESMRVNAALAIIFSLIGIIAYIWARFQNIAFGLAAVVALMHDVLVVLGMIAL